jgi:hypothetical protein
VRDQLVGNWELISYVSYDSDGRARDVGYTGRIVYDGLGNMSAIGMPLDVAHGSRAEGESSPTEGFAYFATFAVDEKTRRVIHRVRGSPTNAAWVNTNLVLHYDLRGDVLALSARNAEGQTTGTFTWQRLE